MGRILIFCMLLYISLIYLVDLYDHELAGVLFGTTVILTFVTLGVIFYRLRPHRLHYNSEMDRVKDEILIRKLRFKNDSYEPSIQEYAFYIYNVKRNEFYIEYSYKDVSHYVVNYNNDYTKFQSEFKKLENEINGDFYQWSNKKRHTHKGLFN